MLILVLTAGFGLAACSGGSAGTAGSPTIASLGASTTTAASSGTGGRSGTTNGGGAGGGHGGTTATASANGTATESLLQWTACMRSHGDPNQSDPTIDVHDVINISIPEDASSLSNQVHAGTSPCNSYLAAAANALRAADPVGPPPTNAQMIKYADCMRVNGVPNYPDPNFSTGETDFNGTGVNPNSPAFLRANDICGKQINAPAWWISGTGPPGDIVVTSGPNGGPGGSGASPRPANSNGNVPTSG